MTMFQLTVNRKSQFYGFMIPTLVTILDKSNHIIFRKRIMTGSSFAQELPEQDYIITFSNKILLGRTISTAVSVSGSVDEKVRVDIEIANVNLLTSVVPFLALFTPIFHYRTSITYGEKSFGSDKTRRKGSALPALPFLALFFFFFILLAGVVVQQIDPNFSDIVIEEWYLEGTDAYTAYTYELLGGIVANVIITPILILLCILNYFLYIKLIRSARRKIIQSADENAPSILYLRSFKDDKITAKQVDTLLKPGISEEETLVAALDDIAPVLCVGRPNETYLPDGPVCIIIKDAQWHQRVADLAQNARLVVLRLGTTEGLLWELQYCLENIDPQKIVLILPKFKSVTDFNNLFNILNQHGIDIQNFLRMKSSRQKGSIWGILYFDANRQPVCRTLEMSALERFFIPLEDKMKEALSDISLRFGFITSKKRYRVRIAVTCAFYGILMIVTILGSYISFKSIEHGRFPQDLIAAGRQIDDIGQEIDGWSSKGQADYLFYMFLNGLMYQDENSVLDFYTWETELMSQINVREFELLMESGDTYPTRYLTLAKKYCTDSEYENFIAYMTQCIELFQSRREELPQEQRIDKAVENYLLSALEELPLFWEDELSWEEQFILEKQIRSLLLEAQALGYNAVPEMRAQIAEIGLEIYHSAVD